MKNYFRTILKMFCTASDVSYTTRSAFYRWLVDEEHSAEKEKALEDLWKRTSRKAPLDQKELKLPYARVREKAGIPRVPPQEEKKEHMLGPWQAVAAVLLVFSSAVTYLFISNGNTQPDLIEQYMPIARTGQFMLADGTCVRLNSGSTLLYPQCFRGKTRSVYLIGEAGFKVARNEKQPFVVKSADFQVTALGTEFNVAAYPHDASWKATLIEGSVRVEYDGRKSNVVLRPNEQFVYDRQSRTCEVLRPDMQDVTAWQRGELVFTEMTLKDIITVLERKYPYAFVYSLNDLKSDKFTFRFRDHAPLEEVAEVVSKVVGYVSCRIKGNTCYVIPK